MENNQSLFPINPFDILKKNPATGAVTLGGERITEQQIKQFKSDIAVLNQLPLWKVLQESTKQYAIDWALAGTPLDDKEQEFLRHLTGKMWLQCLSSQQNIIKTIEQIAL